MKADQRDRITRLHLLNSLFPLLTGEDLYLAKQIEHAINFASTGNPEEPGNQDHFNEAILQLLDKYLTQEQNFGFYHWEASPDGGVWDPLWAREEVIAGLKQISGFEKAMFFGTGLRRSVQGTRKRWNSKIDRDYEEAVEYIRDLATYWTTQNSQLTLILL